MTASPPFARTVDHYTQLFPYTNIAVARLEIAATAGEKWTGDSTQGSTFKKKL